MDCWTFTVSDKFDFCYVSLYSDAIETVFLKTISVIFYTQQSLETS